MAKVFERKLRFAGTSPVALTASLLAAALSVLGLLCASSSMALNAYGQAMAMPVEKVDSTKLGQGALTIFPLDATHLVLAGDFHAPLTAEVARCFGKRLAVADQKFSAGELETWAHRFFYSYAVASVVGECHLPIRNRFETAGYFRLTDEDGAALPLAAQGYWVNAVGEFRMPCQAMPGHNLTPSAELIHFAYLRLGRPLKEGETIRISTAGGALEGSLCYEEAATVTRALKVNQVGYAADAPRKYAYFGMWLGTLGEMPVDAYVGRDFEVVREPDGEVAFRGRTALRAREQYHVNKECGKIPLHGETVLELDFSDLTAPGRYHLRLPGAGRSWSFVVGDDAIGEAFYVTTRGLFHQRSGIAKTTEHTQWTFERDHPVSWRGGFAPNERHYGGGPGGCIRDSKGVPVKLRHFEMVKATATDEELPDVYGGWWDAGDFDRRNYHFRVVECLLTAYMLCPENFSDGQLDLPESGNGIADVVDEAAWGVDVWRRAQNAAGGVGCWLEATSHPVEANPDIDQQRYYLAMPTRESSLEYASYAADLARAYLQSGCPHLAQQFRTSAERAWAFAQDERNRAERVFTVDPKQGALTYREPATLPGHLVYRAALSLYLLTKEEAYRGIAEGEVYFQSAMRFVSEHRRPFFLSPLAEGHGLLKFNAREFREMVVLEADKLLLSQDELAYRNVNWPLNHGYFQFMGWGAGLPFHKGAFFLLAWRLTGQEKYRVAALLLADWMLGANPMGRSMTCGLGTVYPVRILSLPMWSRESQYVDPIPGLVPYTFTGRNNYQAVMSVFRIEVEKRVDQKFDGCNVTLLPSAWTGGRDLSRQECYDIIEKRIPLWRRFVNMESRAVDQNEFTVWETIAPAAAAYGMLLKPGWKPPPEWKRRQPKKTLAELPGAIFLP